VAYKNTKINYNYNLPYEFIETSIKLQVVYKNAISDYKYK